MIQGNAKKVYLPTILSTLLFLAVLAGAYVVFGASFKPVYRSNRYLHYAIHDLNQVMQHALVTRDMDFEAQLTAAQEGMGRVTGQLARAGDDELVGQSARIEMQLMEARRNGQSLESDQWMSILKDIATLQVRLNLKDQGMLLDIRNSYHGAFDRMDYYMIGSLLLVVVMWLLNSFWLVPRFAVRPLEALLTKEREQEAILRQNEAQLQAIASAVASGIVLAGADGRVKFWNASAERLLGHPPEAALGAPLTELVTGPHGEALPFLAVAPSQEKDAPSEEALTVRGRDGRPLDVSLYHTVTTLSGTPHLLVVFRDVTEERQLQSALNRHHAELQALYENAPVMIGVVDASGTILFGNPALIAYAQPEGGTCLGMRLGEALGCVHAAGNAGGCGSAGKCGTCGLRGAVRAALGDSSLPHEFEHAALRQRNGVLYQTTIMGTAVRMETDENPRVLLCLQDITARKQTEEDLRLSEERMTLALEAATDGWWDWDLVTDDLFYSPRWWGMLGYAPNALPADAGLWRRLTHPDDIERVSDFFQQAVESTTENYEVEVRFLHADGHYVPVLSKGHFIRDEEGVAIRACGFNLDLSETKRREGEYESLIQTSMDGFWVADAEGRILRVNHAICDMLQYAELELLQMNIADVDANESQADVAGHIQKIMEFGYDMFDTRLRRRDGVLLEVEASVSFPPESKGQVFAFMRDISQRKAYEATLQASEARFRSYIEHAPIGAVVVDRTGRYLDANRAAAEHLGYTREELLALSIKDLRMDEFETLTDQHFQRVVGGEKGAMEVLLRRKDGSTAPTEVHASRLDDERFLGFHIDLSERKKAESAVLYQAALDSVLAEVSQAMVTEEHGTDIAGQILRHARRLTDSKLSCFFVANESSDCVSVIRPDRPALSLPHSDDCTDPDLPLLECLWSGLGRVDAPCTDSLHFPIAENNEADPAAPLKILALPIIQGSEWLGQIVLANDSRDFSGADLTSIGRLAELYRLHLHGAQMRLELEKSRQQFLQAQKMEAVGRLAGGVAHDFNNILGVIIGYSEFALRNEACDSELREHLESMRTAALRGADLTRQLLAFARKQTVQPRKLDLNESVGAMLKLLGRLAGEQIAVHWHPLNRPLPIQIDPSQFDQLLANLIVNARDAMAGSGAITIGTAFEFVDNERGLLLGKDHQPGSFAILSVADSGCGMDEETLSHIFEPFFTTKPEGQGTGLGLATVHGIVHQNGGFVTAESEPGRGTTFRIYLPLQEAESTGRVNRPENQTGNPSGSETILLVDDQGDFREACRTILQSLGYRVITARNGDDALRSLNGDTDKIQLLITDLVMPGMNGRDLWAHLSVRCPNLRCIYMSGYTADVIGEQGVLDENVCFIDKPFSMSTLAQRIREVLDA